jgi:lipopolysaccharide biosynthesis regulator YciM
MRRLGIFILLVVAFAGCAQGPASGILSEQEEVAFRRGKQRLREGQPDEALQAFLSVIEHRPQAPESHLEAGLLYLNRFNEPVLAIYHFNEYLRLRGNTEQAERVRQLIVTAKKEFARSLPAAPFGGEIDKLDLKELLDKTRAENESLKAELLKDREEIEHTKAVEAARLALLSSPAPSGSGGVGLSVSPKVAQNAAKPGSTLSSGSSAAAAKNSSPRQYTVQDGDTLSIIAKKFYGASSRWKEIAEANKDTLPNPKKLKLGQVLTIP